MDAKTMAGLITDHNFGELTEKVITKVDFEQHTKAVIESCIKGAQGVYNTGFKDGIAVGLGISIVTVVGSHVIMRRSKAKAKKLED